MEFNVLKETLTEFQYDFEKIIDDFILFCFFVGNDFLPSLPSMYIPNGSLAVLFETYKTVLPSLGFLFFFSFSFSFSFSLVIFYFVIMDFFFF